MGRDSGRRVEPSGWRLITPLVAADDAPDAPPLLIAVGSECARVHLLLARASHDKLGDPAGELHRDDIGILQAAVQRLVAP